MMKKIESAAGPREQQNVKKMKVLVHFGWTWFSFPKTLVDNSKLL